MTRVNKIDRQRGFTLVELLIVSIILAILAAIVVPQFASTTTDAQESALRANLAAMRSAISLYRQQHGEYPASLAATTAACAGGTAGTGGAETQQALIDQLTLYTNNNGEACSVPGGGTFNLGPYLNESTIPANPITGSAAIEIVPAGNPAAGDLKMQASGAGLGWKYDVVSGKIIANDTNTDSQSIRYDSY